MAGFLYYLPGHQGPLNLEHLKKSGIGYAFEDNRLSFGAIEAGGPDGGAGALVCVAGVIDPAMVGVSKDGQTWQKIPGSECYVGIFDSDLPKPEDCVRKKALQGHWVECGDGQEWLAPVARALNEPEEAHKPLESFCALPQTRTIDENGAWVQGGIMPRYAALWDTAVLVSESAETAQAGEDAIYFDFENETDAALLCLAINYRIGKAEANLLGLFTDESVGGILGALVDWPVVDTWIKKKKAMVIDGLNTSDGSQD